MTIAVVNDIHIGKDLLKDGYTRATSSQSEKKLPKVLDHIKKHSPDLLVNMGDLIRGESVEEDKKNFEKGIDMFDGLEFPVIHLLGNHEVKQLTVSDIISVWRKKNIEQEIIGSRIIQNVNFVWLDFDQTKSENGIDTFLSSKSLLALDQKLNNNYPAIIFTHYVCTEQNLDGNFYFAKPREIFSRYRNTSDIQSVIKKHKNILAIVSAHTHGLNLQTINKIPYITLPAMVENITAPEINNNFPEIYTIIDLSKNTLNIKCYSREFCFATLEL